LRTRDFQTELKIADAILMRTERIAAIGAFERPRKSDADFRALAPRDA
jgi:hypothetical protein